MENKQKQFKSGTISKSDLKEYEFSLQDEQNKLNELNNQKDTLIMDLNSLMGRDLNKNLNLHDLKEIPYTKYTVDNLDSIIEKFIETDYSIKSLKEQIEIYEVDKNIMEKYNGQEDENEKEYDFDDEIESLDIKILQLNYDIEDKKIELKYALLTDYNNLLKLEKQISINKLNYDTKTNSLQIADKKLKTGQITQTEYSKYNQDVINSLVDYEKSKMNYYIAVETFKLLIKK